MNVAAVQAIIAKTTTQKVDQVALDADLTALVALWLSSLVVR